MRIWLAAGFFLLSGCWTGTTLYRVSDAQVAMAPGLYLAEEGSRRSRLTVLANGRLQLNRGDFVAFAPLDEEGRAFVAWSSGEWGDADDHEDAGLHGLLQRQADGAYLLFVPACADTEEIARAAGAIVEVSNGAAICRFPDRASLESAMRRLRPDPEAAILRLSPVGDGQL